MGDFPCKTSDKSSPSFPDADYDEEQLPNYNQSDSREHSINGGSPDDKLSNDVTMAAEDEDDEMDGSKVLNSNLDSPKPNTDLNDKKVHWTMRDVQLLLKCVEEHLNDFNIQKKHKAVWQAIGAKMEPYGFTTEHCYNKWKNLRRDVRLLVNNPNKIVRNSHILHEVARLILIIYPNVDANTMQVCDRSGIKSLPPTPGGQSISLKSEMSFSGFNSPRSKLAVSMRSNCSLYSAIGANNVHSTPTSVGKSFCGITKSDNIPASALFVDSIPNGGGSNVDDKAQGLLNQGSHPEPDSTAPFQIPSATSLILQSQLFQNILRPVKNQTQDQAQDLSAPQNDTPDPLSIIQQALAFPPSGDPNLSLLTANLLSSLASLPPSHLTESENPQMTNGSANNGCSLPASSNPTSNVFPNQLSGLLPILPPNLLECFTPNFREIMEIIETLRAEDETQVRLAEMASDVAAQLRRSHQSRQVAMEKLLNIFMKQVANGSDANNMN
ncbi:hypothetical protein Aperf_G00000041299 [Anoplocephala perfoliata]